MLQEEGHLESMNALDHRNNAGKDDYPVEFNGNVRFSETDISILGGTVLAEKLEASCCATCPIRGIVFKPIKLDWSTTIDASCPGLTATPTSVLSPITMRDKGNLYISERTVGVRAIVRFRQASDKENFFTVASGGNRLIGAAAGKGVFFKPFTVPTVFPCSGRRDPRVTVKAQHNPPKVIR